MSKKLGTLIKSARTSKGYTQEQLARKVKGMTASDISKAERGEAEPTKEQLKAIAIATGVTQKSLLDAASKTTSKPASSAKKPSSATAKKDYTLTAAEKKLIDLYRAADSNTKRAATNLLKNEGSDLQNLLNGLFGNSSSNKPKLDNIGDLIGSFLK